MMQPQNCRDRLRREGKAYPRSGCNACFTSIRTGLACPHDKEALPSMGVFEKLEYKDEVARLTAALDQANERANRARMDEFKRCHDLIVTAEKERDAARKRLEDMTLHLDAIIEQMGVNLGYFDGNDQVTLDILQGHIKDSVTAIRKLADYKTVV